MRASVGFWEGIAAIHPTSPRMLRIAPYLEGSSLSGYFVTPLVFADQYALFRGAPNRYSQNRSRKPIPNCCPTMGTPLDPSTRQEPLTSLPRHYQSFGGPGGDIQGPSRTSSGYISVPAPSENRSQTVFSVMNTRKPRIWRQRPTGRRLSKR